MKIRNNLQLNMRNIKVHNYDTSLQWCFSRFSKIQNFSILDRYFLSDITMCPKKRNFHQKHIKQIGVRSHQLRTTCNFPTASLAHTKFITTKTAPDDKRNPTIAKTNRRNKPTYYHDHNSSQLPTQNVHFKHNYLIQQHCQSCVADENSPEQRQIISYNLWLHCAVRRLVNRKIKLKTSHVTQHQGINSLKGAET